MFFDKYFSHLQSSIGYVCREEQAGMTRVVGLDAAMENRVLQSTTPTWPFSLDRDLLRDEQN